MAFYHNDVAHQTINDFCKIEREIRLLEEKKTNETQKLGQIESNYMDRIKTYMESQNLTCIPLYMRNVQQGQVVDEKKQFIRLVRKTSVRTITDKTVEFVKTLQPSKQDLIQTYKDMIEDKVKNKVKDKDKNKDDETSPEPVRFIDVLDEWVWRQIEKFHKKEVVKVEIKKNKEKGFKEEKVEPIVIEINETNVPNQPLNKEPVDSEPSSEPAIEVENPKTEHAEVDPSPEPISEATSSLVEPPTNAKNDLNIQPPDIQTMASQILAIQKDKKHIKAQTSQQLKDLYQEKKKIEPHLSSFLQTRPEKRQRVDIRWKSKKPESFTLHYQSKKQTRKRQRRRVLTLKLARPVFSQTLDSVVSNLPTDRRQLYVSTFNNENVQTFVSAVNNSLFQTTWVENLKQSIDRFREVHSLSTSSDESSSPEESVQVVLRRVHVKKPKTDQPPES